MATLVATNNYGGVDGVANFVPYITILLTK